MAYDYAEYADDCQKECDGKCDLHAESIESTDPTS